MRAITSILLLIGFTLCGCSNIHYYWYNPDKLLREARQDCRECYGEAVQQAANDTTEEYYRLPPDVREDSYWPTHSRGSDTLHLGPLLHPTMWGSNHRENLFHGCMKSRGYALTREDELGRNIRKSSLRAGLVAGK
jgi:hypothetical protein